MSFFSGTHFDSALTHLDGRRRRRPDRTLIGKIDVPEAVRERVLSEIETRGIESLCGAKPP